MPKGDSVYKIKLFFIKLWKNEAFCRCLARALIVFFVVYGSMRAFLSCFDIVEFSVFRVTFFSVCISLYLGFMFYKEKNKNIMYLFLLLIFLIMTFFLGRYTNSGFYAIVNIIYKKLEVDLDLTGIIEYTERYTNRYITITSALVFISFGMSVLVNLFVSNTMSIMDVFFATAIPLFAALYFGYNPNPLYIWMVMTGYTSVFVLNRSGKFKYKSVFTKIKEKRDIKKHIRHCDTFADGKMMFCVFSASAVITMAVLFVVGTLFSGFDFYTGERWENYKNTVDDYVKEFITYGFLGVTNDYNSAGGVNGGELGGVAAVRPDYQTDLQVEFTPYSYTPVYLRSYVSCDYTGRRWLSAHAYEVDSTREDSNCFPEVDALKKSYESNDEKSAKGRMVITNVGADSSVTYLPYYTDGDGVSEGGLKIGKSVDVQYYPYNENAVEDDVVKPDDAYTSVPIRNEEAVSDFCNKAGISKTDDVDTVTRKICGYFQKNFPYTMRPGKTPRGEDFVNYFLTTQKKGLCMHYASAATLIFRSLGIPARYVEGYVIAYSDVLDAELEDKKYSDWYDGFSSIGETGVVKVDITDMRAHAWTEIFDEKLGWVVVDTTPTSFGDDDDTDRDFWDMFNKWMDNGDKKANETTEVKNEGNDKFSNSIVSFAGIILVVFAVMIVFSFRKSIFATYKLKRGFSTKNKATNVVNRYGYICNIVRKYQPDFNKCSSHIEQLEFISNMYSSDINEYISALSELMERISYGKNTSISDAEYERAVKELKYIEKIVRNKKTGNKKVQGRRADEY